MGDDQVAVDVPPSALGLPDAIAALRRELAEAQERRIGQETSIGFRLTDITVEFTVAATREGSGEAGVKFWVVNASGRVGQSRTTEHRIALTLRPYDVLSGEDVDIAGEI